MKNQIFTMVILSALLVVSCSPTQKIAYNTANIKRYNESSRVSVSVQQFEDIRIESEINRAQIQAKDVYQKINGKESCVNAEKQYKVPVGLQMANVFAEHLNKKMYFTTVFVNEKEKADYYVSAKIKHFCGSQEFSTKASIGAGFGLIGAMATAGLKTKGNIIIELSDICVYDKKNNLIAKVGDFKKEFSGDFPVNANCDCIYKNINQKLVEFNEELCKVIVFEVKNKNTVSR